MGKEASEVVKQYQTKIEKSNSTKKLKKLAKELPEKFNKLKSDTENDPMFQALKALKEAGTPGSDPSQLVTWAQKVINIFGIQYAEKAEDTVIYSKAATDLPIQIDKKMKVLEAAQSKIK